MQKTVVKDEVYIVTSPTACTISCEHNGETLVLCQVSPGQQKSFLALEDTIEVSSADADIRNFRSAPACYALGGGLFGGDGDASLREGATASVKAQCELAPTDLHQGGTLTDGTVTVEMDEPEEVNASVDFHALPDAPESGYIEMQLQHQNGTPLMVFSAMWIDDEAGDDVASYTAALLNKAESWVDADGEPVDASPVHATVDALQQEIHIELVHPDYAGAAGNVVEACPYAQTPFLETDTKPFSGGGAGEHSLAALMEAINASTAFSATAGIGIGEGGILLTAKESGAAANSVVYTATGCFGSGEVHQGSVRAGADSHVGLFACGVMQTCRYLVVGESSMHIVWPADWTWREGRAPSIADDTNYIVDVFNDGHRTMAQVSMTYDRTND